MRDSRCVPRPWGISSGGRYFSLQMSLWVQKDVSQPPEMRNLRKEEDAPLSSIVARLFSWQGVFRFKIWAWVSLAELGGEKVFLVAVFTTPGLPGSSFVDIHTQMHSCKTTAAAEVVPVIVDVDSSRCCSTETEVLTRPTQCRVAKTINLNSHITWMKALKWMV